MKLIVSTRTHQNPIVNNVGYNSADEIFNALLSNSGAKIGAVWDDTFTEEVIKRNSVMDFTPDRIAGTSFFAVRFDNCKLTFDEKVKKVKNKPTFAFCEHGKPNNFTFVYIFDRLISVNEHTALSRMFIGKEGIAPIRVDSYLGFANFYAKTDNEAISTGNILSPDALLNPQPTPTEPTDKTGSKVKLEHSETLAQKSNNNFQNEGEIALKTSVTASEPTTSSLAQKSNNNIYPIPTDNNTVAICRYTLQCVREENEPVENEAIEPTKEEHTNRQYSHPTGMKRYDDEETTQDLLKLGIAGFVVKYDGVFPYFDRTDFAGRDYIDTTKEEYFELYRKGERVGKVGESGEAQDTFQTTLIKGKERTSKLFSSCIIRRRINPEVGYSQLLACTVWDVVHYFDHSDNVLSPREIVRTVARVMEMDEKTLKRHRITRDKRTIVTNPDIINRKSTARQAVGEQTREEYSKLRMDNGNVSDSTIAQMMGKTKQAVNIHRRQLNIPSLIELRREAFARIYDPTLTNSQIISKMAESGYSVSLATVKRMKQALTASFKAHQTQVTPSDDQVIIQSEKTSEIANMTAPVRAYETEQSNRNSDIVCEPEMQGYGKTSNKAHQTQEKAQMVQLAIQTDKVAQNRPDEAREAMERETTINDALTQLHDCYEMYMSDDPKGTRLADEAAIKIIRHIQHIESLAKLNWCRYYLNQAFEQWGRVLESNAKFYLDFITRKLNERETDLIAS